MELTKKQEEGLKIILERHKNNEKYTTIAGYAGTGKSTLVKFAIAALDVEDTRVAYATYTGKAAEVLRKKGNIGACTLHKLLYEHIPLPGGGFYRKVKTSLDVDIVVVDEISMVPKSMVDLLLSHKVYIIFLGDPFQLPQAARLHLPHRLQGWLRCRPVRLHRSVHPHHLRGIHPRCLRGICGAYCRPQEPFHHHRPQPARGSGPVQHPAW